MAPLRAPYAGSLLRRGRRWVGDLLARQFGQLMRGVRTGRASASLAGHEGEEGTMTRRITLPVTSLAIGLVPIIAFAQISFPKNGY